MYTFGVLKKKIIRRYNYKTRKTLTLDKSP